VRRGWLVVNDASETVGLIPPGDGLRELVLELREPIAATELLGDDEPDELVLEVVANLVRFGFAHVLPSAGRPDALELEAYRRR
jgi:hypothetical protein